MCMFSLRFSTEAVPTTLCACLAGMCSAPAYACDAQRESGVGSMLRVAPLFETLEDLEHSESAMEQLLSDPWYAAHIKGEQECMIGYSDSGKDAGRMAAAWGLYEVQVGNYP